jgi:alpha-1,3-mannosyltransferase
MAAERKAGAPALPSPVRPDLSGRLVVHVVRQYAPSRGGLEDVVSNLARQSLDAGCRVRVVTLDRVFADPALRLPARDTIDGVEVVRIPFRGSSRYPLAPGVFAELADADIVHVHAIDFFYDALALGWLLHRKPMIVTTHGGFFHTRKHAALKAAWFQTLTRLSALAYRHVVCCSHSDLALFGRIAPGRVTLIENGTDTAKFHDRASAVPARRIVTIGRFSANKRLDRLVETMAQLEQREPGWHLDIIGVPSDLTVADLEQAISERRLTAEITLHVGIGNDEIAALIGQASFFASASEYEGFGLVAIEAMSAGLVPVLHGNEAYKALASKHRDIVLVDFADAKEAAGQILAASEILKGSHEDSRKRRIAEAGAYSWDAVAKSYLALYQDCLAGSQPK